MAQNNIIKLESKGDENGRGAGHIRYTKKNKSKLKEKISIKKYNPVIRKHTLYTEKK
jgi:ribosomal protein L33